MPNKNQNMHPGYLLFAMGFFLISLFLLSQIGDETKFSAGGKLFAQPRTWPAISVGGMVLFSLALLISNYKAGFVGTIKEAFTWVRTVEYLGWFMAYVLLVPVVGYLPMTIAFTTMLAFRLGYRKPQTLGLAAMTGAAIVIIFKALLSVKIPGGVLYDYLPSAIRNFMIVNF